MFIIEKLLIGDRVTVRYSKDLKHSGNDFLVGKTGIVTELIMSDNHVTGVNVDVKIARKIKNYFINIESIEGPIDICQARTLSILKSTIL